jgi:nitroimidazol reductase NimA-like FMN-containing flavoprotein (pyridoxamine 5'-phosphate oxidase superfamily)
MHERSGFALHLPVEECWALLGTVTTGRLALVIDGRPEIFPVTFVVDDETVVFRTAGGAKLTAIRSAPLVAFEADGPWPGDPAESWSVVLKGRTGEVRWPAAVPGTSRLPPLPWSAGQGRLVRVVPHEVTGRHVPRQHG